MKDDEDFKRANMIMYRMHHLYESLIDMAKKSIPVFSSNEFGHGDIKKMFSKNQLIDYTKND
jgi:hypothetical protein